jgi:hypothetical protein
MALAYDYDMKLRHCIIEHLRHIPEEQRPQLSVAKV